MKFLITVLTAVVLSITAVKLLPSGTTVTPVTDMQPAFTRVMQTRELRCAYFTWAPYLVQDPNTKQLSGLTYDIVEQVGRILNLKIIWNEEVPIASLAENLANGRNDMACNTLWPAGNRAPYFNFTQGIDFIPARAFVRADDTRFDTDPGKLNSPEVTIPVLDGDYTKAIADEDFPQAKQFALNQDADGAQLLLTVTTGKADVIFVDPFVVAEFVKTNPNSLKLITNMPPVRTFGDAFALAKGEDKLRDTINIALAQLTQSHYIAGRLDHYFGALKGQYYYPAQPFSPNP